MNELYREKIKSFLLTNKIDYVYFLNNRFKKRVIFWFPLNQIPEYYKLKYDNISHMQAIFEADLSIQLFCTDSVYYDVELDDIETKKIKELIDSWLDLKHIIRSKSTTFYLENENLVTT